MFEVTVSCQYEGAEERKKLNEKINSLRKKFKQLSSETYSETFNKLKYKFFVSGEFGTFDGESGIQKIRFYKSKKYIQVEIIIQHDISNATSEISSDFIDKTIIQSVIDIVDTAKSKQTDLSNKIITDLKLLIK